MAYYTTETQAPPAPPAGAAWGQRGLGVGYPTSGPPVVPAYYPTTQALAATSNPAGNANSPGETGAVAGFPYGYKTWEQKAAAMVPPGVFATPVN